MGELNLTIEQFGAMTIGQFNALADAFLRRRDVLEDMFITYSALPIYQSHFKQPPSYQDFVAYREKRPKNKQNQGIPEKNAEYWRAILKEAEE